MILRRFLTPKSIVVSLINCVCHVCMAAQSKDCNPNMGRVTYDEPAAQEIADADWENQTYPFVQSLGFGLNYRVPPKPKKVVHLGTGRYNTQDVPLTADKLTSLAPISSSYVDDNTVLLIFLSEKQKGWTCNAVRHRLFVAKVVNIQDGSLQIKFGGFTFNVLTDDLLKNKLCEVREVPSTMAGRIFVLTPSTYFHWLDGTTKAYSQSFGHAAVKHRPDILEAYLAVGTRYLRMSQAHRFKTVVLVDDGDLWETVKGKSNVDCERSSAQELCVLATAMRKSEADSKATAFKITDSVFNDSGPSFGWQQMDIGVNAYAQSEAVQLFSTQEWPKQRLQTFMYPIRKFSISDLSGLYGGFVPFADSKLAGRENQLAVVSAYVTEISSELASSTAMDKLPRQMGDDDKRLVRLLQADKANVGGDHISVRADAASICEVVGATPDRRKGGVRHDRWLNIVDAYNKAYGTNMNTCD